VGPKKAAELSASNSSQVLERNGQTGTNEKQLALAFFSFY